MRILAPITAFLASIFWYVPFPNLAWYGNGTYTGSNYNTFHTPKYIESYNESGGLVWYNDGIGAGGWIQAGGIHPANNKYLMIGTDTAGPFISRDRGEFWEASLSGIADAEYGKVQYVGDILPIDASWYTGWYIATTAGIFKANGITATSWTYETPPDSGYMYLDASNVPHPYPFSSIKWDGNDLLIAGAGRKQWDWDTATRNFAFYPLEGSPGVQAESQVFPADHESYTLWRYINDDPSGVDRWRPWSAPIADQGPAKDVSVTTECSNVYADTVVVVSCKNGVFVWDDYNAEYVNFGTDYYWKWSATDSTEIDISEWGTGTYSTTFDVQNVHVTTDATIYATLRWYHGTAANQRDDGPIAGVYANNALAPGSWQYIGNTTDIFPAADPSLTIREVSEGPTCTLNAEGAQFCFLRVHEGVGAAVDTLLVADGRRTYGVMRTTVNPAAYKGRNQTWEVLASYSSSTLYRIDAGWQDPPAMSWKFLATEPGNANNILTDFTGVHLSTDAGLTWERLSYDYEDGFSKTRGLVQLCPRDLVQMEDRRVVWGSYDNSFIVSDASDLGNWQYIHPTFRDGARAYPDTAAAADQVYAQNTFHISTYPNFQNSGREAVISVWRDDEIPGVPCRLMAWWDEDGDGSYEFRDIGTDIPGYNCVRLLSMEVMPDGRIIANYKRYDTALSSASWVVSGFYLLTWDGVDTWQAETWNTGLPAAEFGVEADIVFSDDRVWIGMARNIGSTTGIRAWYRNIDGSNDWTVAYAGDPRDVRSMAASSDGETIYVGSYGAVNSTSVSIVKCANPDAETPTWTNVANPQTPSNINTFSMPRPYDYPGTPTVPDNADAWDAYNEYDYARTTQNIYEMAVDPDSSGNLWVCIGGHQESTIRDRIGVYKYTGADQTWTYMNGILPATGMEGDGIWFINHPKRVLISLATTDLHVARLDGTKLSTYNKLRAPGVAPTITDFSIDDVIANYEDTLTVDLSGTVSIAGCTFEGQYRFDTDDWTAFTISGTSGTTWTHTWDTDIAAVEDTLEVQVRPILNASSAMLIGPWYYDSVVVVPDTLYATIAFADYDSTADPFVRFDVVASSPDTSAGIMAVDYAISGNDWDDPVSFSYPFDENYFTTSISTTFPTEILPDTFYVRARITSPRYGPWSTPDTLYCTREVVGPGLAAAFDKAQYDTTSTAGKITLFGWLTANDDAYMRAAWVDTVGAAGDTTWAAWTDTTVAEGDSLCWIFTTSERDIANSTYQMLGWARTGTDPDWTVSDPDTANFQIAPVVKSFTIASCDSTTDGGTEHWQPQFNIRSNVYGGDYTIWRKNSAGGTWARIGGYTATASSDTAIYKVYANAYLETSDFVAAGDTIWFCADVEDTSLTVAAANRVARYVVRAADVSYATQKVKLSEGSTYSIVAVTDSASTTWTAAWFKAAGDSTTARETNPSAGVRIQGGPPFEVGTADGAWLLDLGDVRGALETRSIASTSSDHILAARLYLKLIDISGGCDFTGANETIRVIGLNTNTTFDAFTASGTYATYDGSNVWTPHLSTYASWAAFGTAQDDTAFNIGGSGSWLVWTVTDEVKAAFDDDVSPRFMLGVSSTGTSDYLGMYTDGSTAVNRPLIYIWYEVEE